MRISQLGFSTSIGVSRRWAGAAAAAVCLLPLIASAGTTVYTTDAQFSLGVLSGVNYDAPNSNQLQLNKVGTTFPVMWIANAGEDTLSKIDTTTGRELGRYRTWFGSGAFGNHGAFSGPAPSRSAVDIDGNAYIANRHFDGGRPMVMKVLAAGFIDRNGNLVEDTSIDADNNGTITASETKNVVNGTGATFDCSASSCESQDERVAWTTTLPADEAGGLGRALCIGTDGNLWIGVFNTRRYYKIRATDGAIIGGPYTVPWNPYGCLVDGNGILWSASLGSVLGRLDTNAANPAASAVAFNDVDSNYGIGLGNGKVYLGSLSGFGYREFTPATNVFATPGGSKGFSSTGISVDGSGNIWTGPYISAGVRKYNATTGAQLCSGVNQFPGSVETRGVIVDADNNIWQINRFTNSVAKYRGSDCAPLGNFPVGFDPYTYSDATGFSARNTTTPTGTWTVINDSSVNGQAWSKIAWTESIASGSTVVVSARASDVQANLASLPFLPVSNGANPAVSGRFIQVQTRLNANTAGVSPILFDLTLTTPDLTCDVDRDVDIDKNDIALIRAGIGQTPAANDPRDANGDGLITMVDVRQCTLRCTKPSCAP
jgi:hypothetical protein